MPPWLREEFSRWRRELDEYLVLDWDKVPPHERDRAEWLAKVLYCNREIHKHKTLALMAAFLLLETKK